MRDYGLYESAAVKVQTIKTAIESACLILRCVFTPSVAQTDSRAGSTTLSARRERVEVRVEKEDRKSKTRTDQSSDL
jgi:chaperonin GroEL (HSP60 family)